METSGTERSSVLTTRSSVLSDHRESVYSRNQSRDRLRERDDSPETILTSDVAEEDDQLDPVGDVLDSYYYDEDDEDRGPPSVERGNRDNLSSSPVGLDSDPPELSQTPSRDLDSLDSFHSADHLRQWEDDSLSYNHNPSDGNDDKTSLLRQSLTIRSPSTTDFPDLITADEPDVHTKNTEIEVKYLPPVQISPFQPQSTPWSVEPVAQKPSKRQSSAWQRSSEEIPRRVSVSLQTLGLGTPSEMEPVVLRNEQEQQSKGSTPKMTEIRRDMSGLPQLPNNKARMSRQDWADIEAYSRRHSRKTSYNQLVSNDATTSKLGPQSPPLQRSEPLPQLDEDETIPRRASTSVFDRRSTLFNLGVMSQSGTNKAVPVGAPRDPPRLPPKEHNMGHAHPVRKAVPVERDRYGFKKASDKISVQEYNAWASKYEDHISRRRNKWVALMVKQGLTTDEPNRFPEMCEKVKRYARKGYPPEWRGAMWWYYSGGQHMIQQREVVGLYASLVARVKREELNKDDRDAIERDLDRTFPDNIHFRPEPATDLLDGEFDEEPKLIQDLREVLSCFALNNPNIGYCQSLNFIAGLLLLFLKQDKERVFILLTIITQNHLPGAHARNLANTEVNVLMMLIKDYLPKVWASINDTDLINSGAGSNAHPNSKFQRQPTVALSCTSWFMSLFVGVLPIETVLRVWDAFLYEGPRALYRYALSIFKLGEGELRKYRPGDGEIFMIVQNLPRKCLDPNVLHDLAFVKKGFGNLSQAVIDQKRLFWREQNKITHQTSIKNTRGPQLVVTKDDEKDDDSLRKTIGMGGLRRKASKRFRKMRG